MEYKWLNQKNNNKIIVFFNGWGMDETIVKHLNPENFDVLMFYNYNYLNSDFVFKSLDKYHERNLVAWSMGVMTATLFDIEYRHKTAINGTLYPISDKFGIPDKIFNLTIKNFDDSSSQKFIKNMFNDNFQKNIYTKRSIPELKSELIELQKFKANPNFNYDRIIISDKDKIIPTKNQVRFWNIEPNLKSGHCPFLLFKNWSELL